MEVSDLTRWNAKEDALLAACVAQEGECNWNSVSEKMRTNRNWLICCHSWTKYLKPMPDHGMKGTQEVKSQKLRPVFRSAPAQNGNYLSGKKRTRDPNSLVYSEIYSGHLQSAKKVSRHMPTELPPIGVLAMGTPRPTSAAMGAPRPTSVAMGAPRPTSAATGTPRPSLAAMGTPRPSLAAMGTPRPSLASIGTLRKAVSQSENVLNSNSEDLHFIQRMSTLPEQIGRPSVQNARNTELIPTGAETFDPEHRHENNTSAASSSSDPLHLFCPSSIFAQGNRVTALLAQASNAEADMGQWCVESNQDN